MAKSTTVITQMRKKPGPAPTGKGTLVGVRLQPDLLEILDRFANELGYTRPEALRSAFSQWAESSGFLEHHPRIKEHPVMVFLTTEAINALRDPTGTHDVSDNAAHAVTDWLKSKGYLRSDQEGTRPEDLNASNDD